VLCCNAVCLKQRSIQHCPTGIEMVTHEEEVVCLDAKFR